MEGEKKYFGKGKWFITKKSKENWKTGEQSMNSSTAFSYSHPIKKSKYVCIKQKELRREDYE